MILQEFEGSLMKTPLILHKNNRLVYTLKYDSESLPTKLL